LGHNLERVKGIEPSYAAWEAAVLPLNYTRASADFGVRPGECQNAQKPMQIQLNGEPKTLADQSTLADLVENLDLAGKRIAIEVNREIIPRSLHATHALQEGDAVEVVHAIGGG
jgi:sulfur carrier protein